MVLLLTILGTLWVTAVVLAWFWLGARLVHEYGFEGGAYYYTFSWTIAGAVAATPFWIYAGLA